MLRLTLRILFGESQSELLQQFFHRHVMVRRNWFQDTFDERANLQGIVPWNCDMMLTIELR